MFRLAIKHSSFVVTYHPELMTSESLWPEWH